MSDINDLPNKFCPECGSKLLYLKICIQEHKGVQPGSFEFDCGHKHHEVTILENLKIWEYIKGKIRRESEQPQSVFLTRTEPGKNPKSVDGVTISWSKDKLKNEWHHVITDIKTGKILHDEHMLLDQHK